MNDSSVLSAPLSKTPKTHYLFLRIIALVARGPKSGMTVREIAQQLGLEPAVVAACIALHVHLEHQRSELIPLPLPAGYWVPGVDEFITSAQLEPPDLFNSPSRNAIEPDKDGQEGEPPPLKKRASNAKNSV